MKVRGYVYKVFFGGMLALIVSINGYAQLPDLSPQQLRMLQSLSPAERDKLLKKYSPGASAAVPKQLALPDVVIPENSAEKSGAIEKQTAKATDQSAKSVDKKEPEKYQKLKQFGYDLFSGVPTTFAPATDIPVPVDYVIGPGDTILVQLYGKENANYELQVNREGAVQFPSIGPVVVAGLSFDEMKSYLNDLVSKQLIGVSANITMGVLRSIRVFILGEANRPGAYTVSSLSTMTNALFVSGGISKLGSLRNIQLKRKGKLVATMDLYDLLLNGDISSDTRLLPGDVIFIPPVGKTCGVTGEVLRPAIYELKNEKTVAQLIELSGGMRPSAYAKMAKLERFHVRQQVRKLIDLDLLTAKGNQTLLKDGDVLLIPSVYEKIEGTVKVSGHVKRENIFQWFEGMRVTDVVSSVNDLLPRPDLNYALIVRERQEDLSTDVIRINLRSAIKNSKSQDNMLLEPDDELLVFNLDRPRSEQVGRLVSNLEKQSSFMSPAQIVSITGNVRFPGRYPLTQGMTLKELFNAAYDVLSDTDINYIACQHQVYDAEKGRYKLAFESYDLTANPPENIYLNPQDNVHVFKLNESRQAYLDGVLSTLSRQAQGSDMALQVNIKGSVKYPGTYPLEAGMSVARLISIAGGYTEDAYTINGELIRYEVNKDQEFSSRLINMDLVQLKRQPLMAYDQVIIKQKPNWQESRSITLKGEFRFPGTYSIQKGETLYSVLARAGGLTEFAYPEAAIFLRKSIREKEEKLLQEVSGKLREELATKQLSDAEEGKTQSIEIESILEKVEGIKPQGRLVIDLPKITDNQIVSENELVLEDGDQLFVPGKTQEVSVVGQVQFPTSHLYEPGLKTEDYISRSGGYAARADEDRVYIIKASGKVSTLSATLWYESPSVEINPGDSIVVPYDVDQFSMMAWWKDVSQILFQLSTTAAALTTVGAI